MSFEEYKYRFASGNVLVGYDKEVQEGSEEVLVTYEATSLDRRYAGLRSEGKLSVSNSRSLQEIATDIFSSILESDPKGLFRDLMEVDGDALVVDKVNRAGFKMKDVLHNSSKDELIKMWKHLDEAGGAIENLVNNNELNHQYYDVAIDVYEVRNEIQGIIQEREGSDPFKDGRITQGIK